MELHHSSRKLNSVALLRGSRISLEFPFHKYAMYFLDDSAKHLPPFAQSLLPEQS